ncbi:hypothetical protein KQI41_09665 [Tissierella pigra]|uniref:Uncharacterized protein n=1 Tax=Tissierella pigra TaxID=2607614 RepID=A0A6N7XU86_9FIRM|nr:CD1247 N-terminal domain-containing protein [Tissierella pigra]MBU5426672.1 hypothetical protein [Tissierella pigra]MST99887.1 hypothetical protein [Tissierella pigra]
MDYLIQKVSYLRGLADGLGIDESSKEGKLLLHIVDILEEFADVLDETIENQEDLEEYVTFIDEDLADVEDDIYGEDDEDDDYYYDDEEFDFDDFCDDDDCCCHCEEDFEEE